MRLETAKRGIGKGWYLGPWNSDIPVSIGYANQGVDEPHEHRRITEIYVVGCGTADVRVEQQTVTLRSGDLLLVEPGESHTFLSSSDDYFHLVLQLPALEGEEARDDKRLVARSRLGL